MSKHKKLMLIFIMSLIGFHFFSVETSKEEYAYEHGLTQNQNMIIVNMSFVTAFLFLSVVSALELRNAVQSYVDNVYVTRKEDVGGARYRNVQP
jgi:uncharacterized membrane protein